MRGGALPGDRLAGGSRAAMVSRGEQARVDASYNCPGGGIRAIQERNGWFADEHDWPNVRMIMSATPKRSAPAHKPADKTRLGKELAELANIDEAVSKATDDFDETMERLTDQPYPSLAAAADRAQRIEQRRLAGGESDPRDLSVTAERFAQNEVERVNRELGTPDRAE